MAEIDLTIPDLGESQDIELVKWYLKVGASFKQGDDLCELVTDKAAFTLEAPCSGQLKEILNADGSIVQKGQKVGLVSIIS